ncbi:MAG: hypothetical protein WCF67_02600 [Chitinophagaceae bacterium]
MDSIIRWGLNFFEILACVTGFVYWSKWRHSYWKWFPVYLAVIVLVELTGKYLWLNENIELNISLYKYFGIPVQFLFYFWLFNKYFRSYKENKWPAIGAAIYIISALVDVIYLNKEKFWFSSFSYMVGNIILVVLIMIFLIRMTASGDLLEYKTNLMFWVCIGLLIFYLGTLPFYGLRNYLFAEYHEVFRKYWYIQFGFGYLMYISFVIGFVCSRQR